MPRLPFAVAVALMLLGSFSAFAGSGSVSYDVSKAHIQGDTVSMPVTNNTLSSIDVEMVAIYDEAGTFHTGSTVVTLAAKQTGIIVVAIQTITDDIDPQTLVVDSEVPVAQALALSADED